MRIFIGFLLLTLSFAVKGSLKMNKEEPQGFFSGRISKVNMDAGIVRVKVDFNNQKYLNKKDKVEFWDERDYSKRCKAYIIGKTSDYLLLKIPEVKECRQYVFMVNGAYIKFFSQDLVNNLEMGKELVSILLKKQLALKGKYHHLKKGMDNYIEKVNAVNARYKILRDKLQLEWNNEIKAVEEDQGSVLEAFRGVERQLDEINYKLERYRIEDENLKLDRWALDPRQHFKK